MINTITYSNYKFDIEPKQNQVYIKAFDTVTMELYEGTVYEHEIYVNPISKFAKLLVNGLEQQKDFAIRIDKCPDKLKCHLTYKTDFIELEEAFSLGQVSNTQAIEYHMRDKIKELEAKLFEIDKKYQFKITELEKTNRKLLEQNKNQELKLQNLETNLIETDGNSLVSVDLYTAINSGMISRVYMPKQLDSLYISKHENTMKFLFHRSGKLEVEICGHCQFGNKLALSKMEKTMENLHLKKIVLGFIDSYVVRCISINLNNPNYVVDEIYIKGCEKSQELINMLVQFTNYKKLVIGENIPKLKAHCEANSIDYELRN